MTVISLFGDHPLASQFEALHPEDVLDAVETLNAAARDVFSSSTVMKTEFISSNSKTNLISLENSIARVAGAQKRFSMNTTL